MSELASGGAERVISTLANAWAARGREVTLLTFHGDEPPFFELHSAIAWRPLGIPDLAGARIATLSGLRRIRILHRALLASRPDVVVAFVDRTNVDWSNTGST